MNRVGGVLLVEDCLFLRRGLVECLRARSGWKVVGEASGGAEGIRRVVDLAPDLVLLDADLPDLSAPEFLREISTAAPVARPVLYSVDEDQASIDALLALGARGLLVRRAVFDEVASALELVMRGSLYLSPELRSPIIRRYLARLVAGPGTAKPATGPRDRFLLSLIARGLSTRDIGLRMGLRAGSVRNRRARLMRRLGCSGVAGLVRYAIRQGLVSP